MLRGRWRREHAASVPKSVSSIERSLGVFSMSNDLSQILKHWRFHPDRMRVRVIAGDDGHRRIQLRVDLGILQMEMDGRPDGLRPKSCESWLDYYEQQNRLHEQTHPDSAAFLLAGKDCVRLLREGVQYYHRYLSFWHLEMYDLCVRDTERNLRLFAFVRTHTRDERHSMQFDQWRPYVLMMRTRALATPLQKQERREEAVRVIDAGIEAIRQFLDEYHHIDRAAECVELAGLERWREELLSMAERAAASRPKTVVQILRQQMDDAVAAEEFEKAAKLRDQIRKLSETALNDEGRP
jgi:hypothetical protein